MRSILNFPSCTCVNRLQLYKVSIMRVTWWLKFFYVEGGNSVQYEVPDLTCLLDEQAATVDQLSSASEHQLVSVLPVLSDAGLVHICALMCSVSASEQSKLGSLVCRLLLLPRVGTGLNRSLNTRLNWEGAVHTRLRRVSTCFCSKPAFWMLLAVTNSIDQGVNVLFTKKLEDSTA